MPQPLLDLGDVRIMRQGIGGSRSAQGVYAEAVQTVAQTARDLGINAKTLPTWLSTYHQGGSRAPGQLDSEHLYEERTRLKKEHAFLKEERAI